jgi:hypothetical protein
VIWGIHLKRRHLRSSSLLLFWTILPCHALGDQRKIFPSTSLFPIALVFRLLFLLIGITDIFGHFLSFEGKEYSLCSQGGHSRGCRNRSVLVYARHKPEVPGPAQLTASRARVQFFHLDSFARVHSN